MELLYQADDIFGDGTFAPILGLKKYFKQLYIYSVRKELPNGSVLSYPCVFVFMVSKEEANYDMVFQKIKNDVEDEFDLDSFQPPTIHLHTEKGAFNSFRKSLPIGLILFCFFHILQSFRRKLCQLGFKNQLDVYHRDHCPEFITFWNFLSGNF